MISRFRTLNTAQTTPVSGRRMHRDVGLLFAAVVFGQALYIAALMVVAQRVGPDEFGVFTQFTGFCALFTVSGAWAYENALFVARSDRARQAILGTCLVVCLINLALMVFVFQATVDRVFGFPRAYLVLAGLMVLGQCAVLICLAIHGQAGRFGLIAGNRIGRVVLTVAVWGVGILGLGAPAVLVLPLGAVIGAWGSVIFLGTKAFRCVHWPVPDGRTILRAARDYRRFPMQEAPALLITAVSHNGLILLTGALYGATDAGLVGLGVMAITKPAGLVAQSFGRVVQSRYAACIRQNDSAGAAALVRRYLVLLLALTTIGVAMLIFLLPGIVVRAFGADWHDLARILPAFAPVLIVVLGFRPLYPLLSIRAAQPVVLRLELIAVGASILGFVACVALEMAVESTIWVYGVITILPYIVNVRLICYRLCSFTEAMDDATCGRPLSNTLPNGTGLPPNA